MYSVIVREKKIVAVSGVLSVAAGAVCLMLIAGSGVEKQNRGWMLLCVLTFGGIVVLGLLMLTSYFLRKLCLGYTNCYYRTMLGRRTEFALRDIKKVEQKFKFGEMMLILWGSDGKQLARLEMNMKNAEKILPFLKEYQLPAIKSDPLWQNKVIWENMKKRYEDYKNSRYYPERQKNYRKAVEEEWKDNPKFYELFGRIRTIRFLARILDVLGIVMAAFIWVESREKAAVWLVLYPLIIFGFYIAFPRVLIWDINTRNAEKEKKDYVEMPAIGLAITLGFGILRLTGINIEDTWKAFAFETALFIVLLAFLLILFKKKRVLELGFPIVFLWIYCFASVDYWNCAFNAGEPEHIRAEVTEKKISSGGRSGDDYYLMLRTGDGREVKAEVVYRLYEKTEKGDSVLICRHVSVFGIHYYYVHL